MCRKCVSLTPLARIMTSIWYCPKPISQIKLRPNMMTSSNGNIYWPFMREIHRWPANSPHKWPVTRRSALFFDLRLNTRLSKQWWGWWFETPSRPVWRHCHEVLNNWYFTSNEDSCTYNGHLFPNISVTDICLSWSVRSTAIYVMHKKWFTNGDDYNYIVVWYVYIYIVNDRDKSVV